MWNVAHHVNTVALRCSSGMANWNTVVRDTCGTLRPGGGRTKYTADVRIHVFRNRAVQ